MLSQRPVGVCTGKAGEKGSSAWENTHPHAKPCFHSEKCSPDAREDNSPALKGCLDSLRLPPSPLEEIRVTWRTCFLGLVPQGRGAQGAVKHALPGWRVLWGREGAHFLAIPQASPYAVWWPRVDVCEHTTFGVSMGWGGGGGRRWEKASGNRILGYKSPQKLLRGPTCVQGGKKNLTLHMGKHTPG